jgi:hypothetical protein
VSLTVEIKKTQMLLASEADAPENEACTCDWVIMPLLLEAGYDRKDILSQASDAQGKTPDYTILPKSMHKWFLEAKAWDVSLQDRHAIQAISYAHTAGSRWVVLTNGREWRLYDDHIIGVDASGRLVARASLEETEAIESFLLAISRESMQSGEIERFARADSLKAILREELQNPSGKILRSIASILGQSHPNLSKLTPEEIAREVSGLVSSGIAKQPAGPQAACEAEDKKPRLISSSSTGTNAPFWSKISEASKPKFQTILEFLEGQGLSTNWGVSGFSAGFPVGRKRIVVLYGMPGGRRRIGDHLLFFGGEKGCWESKLIPNERQSLVNAALETGLFERIGHQGAGLVCRLDRVRTELDLDSAKAWILRCHKAIRSAHEKVLEG